MLLHSLHFAQVINIKMNSSAALQWSRLTEEYLIEKIRSHRCLWDHRIAEYSKKGLKWAAYNVVTSEGIIPRATKHNSK